VAIDTFELASLPPPPRLADLVEAARMPGTLQLSQPRTFLTAGGRFSVKATRRQPRSRTWWFIENLPKMGCPDLMVSVARVGVA
jgi:hypothetical protein